ncbi:MAG: gamma-glutamylcyclotransferase [Deltaproteobacteria bacterium]|jgi:gamma-glutamylcyclotransferase (GGCT)/AIG2-like uncharacterized protein YtfP|nr:gamma-glutamylcyclotransferase [Deltaproteobacteria bacterium]
MTEYNLFVYGTLKAGCHNSHLLPKDAPRREGIMLGRMYSNVTYPFVTLKRDYVFEHGSRDLGEDQSWAERLAPEIAKGVDFVKEGLRVVFGEVVTLAQPERVIPALDRLEGYLQGRRYGMEDLYVRVLTGARIKGQGGVQPVWTYVANLHNPMVLKRCAPESALPEGYWPTDRE